MNIPKLKKERTVKSYHGYELIDNYAYVDQPHNIILDNGMSLALAPEKTFVELVKGLHDHGLLPGGVHGKFNLVAAFQKVPRGDLLDRRAQPFSIKRRRPFSGR